jgi:ATP-dependent helicase IRC3
MQLKLNTLSPSSFRLLSSLPSLRPYQLECIEASLKAFWERGISRQAVSLPVGSGKTVIFSNLIQRILSASGENGRRQGARALVLAHREELLYQAVNQLQRWCPALRVGLEQGNKQCNVQETDVIVASVPSLGRMGSPRLSRFDPAAFCCIVVDEAHHAAAPSYQRVLEHFRVRHNPHVLLWGCSATLSRNDALSLGVVFEEIVYHLDLERMFHEGWLCPVRSYDIHTDLDLGDLVVTQDQSQLPEDDDAGQENDRAAGGSEKDKDDDWQERDFDPKQLCLAINTPERNRLVAEQWHRFAYREHGRQSTIVFALSVEHVLALQAEFVRLGVRAEALTGSTSDAVRASVLDSFAAGRTPVLVNCAVLTEGTDLPRTDCILLTRPTCNANLYIQMVGRGLRQFPGKDYCLVLDVKDRLRSAHQRSLVTFPTLQAANFQTNKLADDDEEAAFYAQAMEAQKRLVGALDPRATVQITSNSAADSSHQSILWQPPPLHLCHQLAWVRLSPAVYVCSTRQGRAFAIFMRPSDGGHQRWLGRVAELLHMLLDAPKNIVIEPEGPLHIVLEKFCAWLATQPLNDAPNMKKGSSSSSSSPSSHSSLPSLGEQMEKGKVGDVTRSLLAECRPTAYWRQDLPVKWRQLQVLKRIFKQMRAENEDWTLFRACEQSWTVGQASLVLCRFLTLKANSDNGHHKKSTPLDVGGDNSLDRPQSWRELIGPCLQSPAPKATFFARRRKHPTLKATSSGDRCSERLGATIKQGTC